MVFLFLIFYRGVQGFSKGCVTIKSHTRENYVKFMHCIMVFLQDIESNLQKLHIVNISGTIHGVGCPS